MVTLSRPDRSNAMTATMFGELERAAIELDDEDDLRAVIITGAGKAFCAGYDLADAGELPKLSGRPDPVTDVRHDLRFDDGLDLRGSAAISSPGPAMTAPPQPA